MNSRPTPYQGVALPLRYSGTAISGQCPTVAAIPYENAIGKGGRPAMSTKASEREKRRAAALRANLRRRKTAAVLHSSRTGSALGSELSQGTDKRSSDGPKTAQKSE